MRVASLHAEMKSIQCLSELKMAAYFVSRTPDELKTKLGGNAESSCFTCLATALQLCICILPRERSTSFSSCALIISLTGRKIVCACATNHRKSRFTRGFVIHGRKALVIVKCGLKTETSKQLSAEDIRAKYSYSCPKDACFSVIQVVCSLQNECIVNWYQIKGPVLQ